MATRSTDQRIPLERDKPPSTKTWRRRWTPRLMVCALLLAMLVIFVAQNYEVVELRVFGWRSNLRLAWALLASGLIGFAIGMLLPRFRR